MISLPREKKNSHRVKSFSRMLEDDPFKILDGREKKKKIRVPARLS